MSKPEFDLGEELRKQLERQVPGPRNVQTVTREILALKQQAGDAILGIGQRLIEAKEMMPHGDWLPWLENEVEFSERTAQNFMRLAREWQNPQTFADLGASKALTLLALPPKEREQFLAETHEVDGKTKTPAEMSARELERAVRQKKSLGKAEQTNLGWLRCKSDDQMAKFILDVATGYQPWCDRHCGGDIHHFDCYQCAKKWLISPVRKECITLEK